MSGTDLSQVSEASARSHSSEDPVGERVIGRRIIATQRAVDESLAAWLSKMDDLVDRGVFGTHDWTSYEDEKAYVKSYFERHAHLSDGRKNTMALKNELDTLQRESAMNNTILESLSHVLNDIPPILPPDLDLETRKRTERLERELQEERDELKAQRAKLKDDQERFEQQKEELLEQFTKTKHEWETRVLEKLDDDQKRKDREASSAAQTSKEKDLVEAIESLRKFREDQVFEKHVKEMEARNVHNELELLKSPRSTIN
jgi:DNA repair exonuclease SbcCD ATPase subunit